MITSDAICVRDITREPLAMVTCISGSKCVTRLIKILCDLLRRTERDRERGGEPGEREWEKERRYSRTTMKKRTKEEEVDRGRMGRERGKVKDAASDEGWGGGEEGKRRWERGP